MPLDQRPSGWRARIGVITPTVNTITEPEFARVAPDGVTAHFTRMPIHRHPEADGFKALFADLDVRVGELATCAVDVVAYNCTVGSMSCPADVLLGRISEKSGGVPAVSTANSVLAAFKSLGIAKVSLATPYDEPTNEHERAWLKSNGIEVVAMGGYPFGTKTPVGSQYASVSPQQIYDHALSLDRPEADAIFVSCCNFGSAAAIEALEQAAEKPVITSNMACAWAALRAAGVDDPILGYGRLLSDF